MSGEEKEFELDGWLKDNELTQTTKESLVKAGFESERSLKKLSDSLMKGAIQTGDPAGEGTSQEPETPVSRTQMR